MPDYLEKNAGSIRSAYLSFVHGLGSQRILGKTIVDHLLIRPSLSAWWMSLVFESSHVSSSHLNDLLKLISLIEWASENKVISFHLVSDNLYLGEALSRWCNSSGVNYTCESVSSRLHLLYYTRLLSPFIYTCRSLLFMLRYLLRFLMLRDSRAPRGLNYPASLLFVNYSANMSKDSLFRNTFQSAYWGSLIERLSSMGYPSNWLHVFVKDDVFDSCRTFTKVLNRLNKDSSRLQRHVSVDCSDTVYGIIRAFSVWLIIALKSSFLFLNLKSFTSFNYLLPLIIRDWMESFIGPTSLSNLLFVSKFETILLNLPHQRLGFYLQENQPWEYAFLYAWKIGNHGTIVGVPHSTVRFWDLRYFSDPNCLREPIPYSLPLPDLIGLNGPYALNTYKEALYPEEKLVKLESLRYSCIFEVERISTPTYNSHSHSQIKLIVFGDYVEAITLRQLRFLVDSLVLVEKPVSVFFKPHPVSSSNFLTKLNKNIKIVTKPISQLLKEYDLYFVSSGSSSAVDLYFAGENVVTYLDPNIVNLSPLRGLASAQYAKHTSDLAYYLNNRQSLRNYSVNPSEYFHYDSNLTAWTELISSLIGSQGVTRSL